MEEQLQSAPILRTKLHRPTVTAELLCRDRLHDLMDRAWEVPLTLVSAPAGYGKSSLASCWTQGHGRATAWVSLDAGESDLRVFLLYVLAAIEQVYPGACPITQELTSVSDLPPVQAVAAHLANEMDALDEPLVLVLDDFHHIEPASPVHRLVRHLLEHPPRGFHLVLLARRDPPLPLASLRASSRIAEVRLQDLRFTEAETAQLLNATAGLDASTHALANVQREVEGWAAGLRLLSLALRHASDPDAYLEALQGGLPQTQKYLFHEVLARQSPALQEGLLKASLLDRFCPELLDALLADKATASPPATRGQELVDELRRGSLFAVELDPQGEWFRFHHLFQGLLRRELLSQASPSEIAALHALASAWFESQGFVEEAIQHALAAGDEVRAAEIVEGHRHAELDADRWWVVNRWIELLPEELRLQRVELLLAQAWTSYFQFETDRLVSLVEQLESLLDESSSEPMALAELGFFKSFLLYWQDKGEESRRYSQEALTLCPDMPAMMTGEVEVYLALGRQMAGHGQSALDSLEEKIRADRPGDVLLSRLVAAQLDIQLLSGSLAAALREAQRLVSVAERLGSTYARLWGQYPEALAHLHSFHLDDAVRSFLAVVERRDFFEKKAAADALAGLALTYQLQGLPERAEQTAEELSVFARETGDPGYLLLAQSCRARLAVLQGDLGPALEWARSVAVEVSPPGMFFWLEDPIVTRARVRIAEGTEESLHQALETLGALEPELEALHLTCQAIELAVLTALALERQGRGEAAQEALTKALNLARPGGWIRPFVEAGPLMAGMLEGLGEKDDHSFVSQVLAAFHQPSAASPAEPAEPEPQRSMGSQAPSENTNPNDLTNRELDILELLGQRLQNKEIAARLCISAHTVNDHLKHVYQKLGVSGRRQAVAEAVERGIVSSR